jgi:hypothetical protein
MPPPSQVLSATTGREKIIAGVQKKQDSGFIRCRQPVTLLVKGDNNGDTG